MKYFIIVILLFFLELLYFKVATHLKIYDKPNERSSHKTLILRGGGIIFLFGAILFFFYFGFQYPWFMLGLFVVALVSTWDDVHSLPDSVRLFVQFISVFLLFCQLGIIKWNLWWIVLPAWVICVGILSAYNFMDGINGITGGYSLAVLLPLLYINARQEFIAMPLLICTVLADLVFCFFNYRRKARCFAGDVGAVSVAFILVFAIGMLMVHTKDYSYIVFLAVYGVDTVLTIIHRILLHENLGVAHRKHAYQILANELKIPHLFVSSFYMMLQLIVSAGLIWLPINHYVYAGIVLVLLSLVYVFFMKKYYHLHEEYLAQVEVRDCFS